MEELDKKVKEVVEDMMESEVYQEQMVKRANLASQDYQEDKGNRAGLGR